MWNSVLIYRDLLYSPARSFLGGEVSTRATDHTTLSLSPRCCSVMEVDRSGVLSTKGWWFRDFVTVLL